MDLDYEAGIAFKRGDFDTAARILRIAREAEPDRKDHWNARQMTVKRAESQRTPLRELLERRHSRAGIIADDPGLRQWISHNRSIGIDLEAEL